MLRKEVHTQADASEYARKGEWAITHPYLDIEKDGATDKNENCENDGRLYQ
jgi:hypothetical protein